MAGFDDFTDQFAIFDKLLTDSENQVCFDCGAKNPTSASISFCVYLCNDCANVHWLLPYRIGKVRTLFLDWWPPRMVLIMTIGGNKRARLFFKNHGLTGGGDIEAKYSSEAATVYKNLLFSEFESIERTLPSSAFGDDNNLEIKEINVARKRFPNAKSISSAQFFGDKENVDQKNKENVDQKNKEINVARKRFPNAKSISSAQFFDDKENVVQKHINDTEAKMSLLEFSTSTAISSADLFGRGVNDSPVCSIQDWIKSIFR